RMHAARVVADHAAERAVGVCGRIRREGQMMPFGCFSQPVEHEARLHASPPEIRIERDQVPHVLRVVEDHCDVAALTGEARPAAAWQDRYAVIAADRDGLYDILSLARQDDADRYLAVVGS